MCVMLYLATSREQPLLTSPELRIEPVDPERRAVRQWFSLPSVRFVGAYTGCSCGFPSIGADVPIDYFDGMFKDVDDREADLKSLRALLRIVGEHVEATGEAQLCAVWNGEEGEALKGRISVRAKEIDPERFFFIERFLYRVTAV